MAADIRLQIRVKSARILRAMEQAGFYSAAEVCRVMGRPRFQQGAVGALINFKASPLLKAGGWRPIALELATCLHVEPDDLWPEYLQRVALKNSEVSLDITIDQFASLASGEGQLLAADQVARLLAPLKPRERQVIEMRFGLNGNGEHTLKQCLSALGVASVEGARRIEDKAFRKMRKVVGRGFREPPNAMATATPPASRPAHQGTGRGKTP